MEDEEKPRDCKRARIETEYVVKQEDLPKRNYRFKSINDPVHGLIKLDEALFAIVDTSLFQRLRDLKQLGGMYFVFPGASHNRFEHCIGTSFLAGKWMRHLRDEMKEMKRIIEDKLKVEKTSQGREILGTQLETLESFKITDKDVFLVEVAGLCHDLGHGPFSHTFEKVLKKICHEQKVNFDETWEHEVVSVALLQLINHEAKVLLPEEVEMVAAMIKGKVPDGTVKRFMYQIVNNEDTSIDVDKFDYLSRDCYSASLPLGFHFGRLIEFSRVGPEGGICFRDKEAYNIFQMFATRASLHHQMYQHRVVKGIELMIVDVLLAAAQKFDLATMVKDKDYTSYAFLTDSVLREIERDRTNKNLQKAQSLVEKIRTHQTYRWAAERTLVSADPTSTGDTIATVHKTFHEKAGELSTHAEMVSIQVKFFASAKSNPFAKEDLFYDSDDWTTTALSAQDISKLIPAGLEPTVDVSLRLYIKEPSQAEQLITFFEEVTTREVMGVHVSPIMKTKKLTRWKSDPHIGKQLFTGD